MTWASSRFEAEEEAKEKQVDWSSREGDDSGLYQSSSNGDEKGSNSIYFQNIAIGICRKTECEVCIREQDSRIIPKCSDLSNYNNGITEREDYYKNIQIVMDYSTWYSLRRTVSVSLGNLLQLQDTLGTTPDLVNKNLHFIKIWTWFIPTLKPEKHCSRQLLNLIGFEGILCSWYDPQLSVIFMWVNSYHTNSPSILSI